MVSFNWFWACIALLAPGAVLSDPLDDDLFTEMVGIPCIRLLTKDGRFGCASKEAGVSGKLYLMDTVEKYDTFLQNVPDEDTIAVLDSKLLSRTRAQRLSDVGIKGIMTLWSDELPPEGYSGEDISPQDMFRPAALPAFEWNPRGDSLIFQEFGFPIVQLNDGFETSIAQRAAELNEEAAKDDSFRSVAADMRYQMQAKTNSTDCLQNFDCLPLGGYSVWSAYGEQLDKNAEFIVLAVRMDATAMFHRPLGADSTLSGLTVMLAAAQALKNDRDLLANLTVPDGQRPRQVVFMVFQGESYGFLGSRKFVQDTEYFQCEETLARTGGCLKPWALDLAFQNFSTNNVVEWIELNQIGYFRPESANPGGVFVYKTDAPELNDLFTDANASAESSNIFNFSLAQTPVASTTLPPSSAWSFINNPELNRTFPAFIITDHDGAYNNLYYQSQFDREVDENHLLALSTFVARLLKMRKLNTREVDVNVTASAAFVGQLVTCFRNRLDCDLANDLGGVIRDGAYTSVFQIVDDLNIDGLPKFVSQILADATGVEEEDAPGCGRHSDCAFTEGQRCGINKCVQSVTNYHQAVDPALVFNYDTKVWEVNETLIGDTPLFTESNWRNNIRTRLFQVESPNAQWVIFFLGIGVIVVSFVVSTLSHRFCRKRFKML